MFYWLNCLFFGADALIRTINDDRLSQLLNVRPLLKQYSSAYHSWASPAFQKYNKLKLMLKTSSVRFPTGNPLDITALSILLTSILMKYFGIVVRSSKWLNATICDSEHHSSLQIWRYLSEIPLMWCVK